MQAPCASGCIVGTQSPPENEQNPPGQTTEKAPNPALEHPKTLQHSDALLLCKEGLKASGSASTGLIPTTGL